MTTTEDQTQPAVTQPFDPNALFQQYGGQHAPTEYVQAVEAAGYIPQLVSGKVPTTQLGGTVLADVTDGRIRTGDLEQQSFSERSGLATSGTANNAYSYFDEGRGVQVHAPAGYHFELYPGGGVKLVQGLISKGTPEGAPATSLFTQGTQGVPGGAEGETQATPGFKEEQLAYEPAEGKTIARTGQTIFNPATGTDVQAQPGNVLIQYTDGTFEERPFGGQPGTTKPLTEGGPTAQELGITRQTEIKNEQGGIARAPMSAAEALAAAKSPEEMDRIIQEEGQKATGDLQFVGESYRGKTAGQGNAFYVDPETLEILERPAALRSVAQTLSIPGVAGTDIDVNSKFKSVYGRAPSADELEYWMGRTDKVGGDLVGAMQFAKQSGKSVGEEAGIAGSTSPEVQLAKYGITPDPAAAQSNPIGTLEDWYSTALQKSGVPEMKVAFENIQKEVKDLDAKHADEVENINLNPWLSEADRSRRVTRATEKYDTKRGQLTAQQQLYQSYLDSARQEAQFITSNAIQQYNADRVYNLQLEQFAFEKAEAKIDNQLKFAQLAENKRQFDAGYGIDIAKFQEDVRQFGLNYALQQAQESRLSSSSGFEGIKELNGGLYDITSGQWLVQPGETGKPLSGDAAKVYSIATTMIPEVNRLKAIFENDYRGALTGYLTGHNRDLVKLVENVADKVGRLRSGGAINVDEANRFKKQIASTGDLAFGNKDGAITALDGLIAEANSVSSSIKGGGDVLGLGFFFNQQAPNQVKGYKSSVAPMSEIKLLTPAEKDLFTKESGLNPLAKNPNSTAFGIWQGLKATREKYGKMLGINPDTTNFNEQLAMAREYIKATYRTAERAVAFWNATKQKKLALAPADLQGKVQIWINKGYVGY